MSVYHYTLSLRFWMVSNKILWWCVPFSTVPHLDNNNPEGRGGGGGGGGGLCCFFVVVFWKLSPVA